MEALFIFLVIKKSTYPSMVTKKDAQCFFVTGLFVAEQKKKHESRVSMV